MYLDFFDMSVSPFPTVAVSENYFGFHGAQQALESLRSAIQRQAGPCLIIGPAGTGKSILLDRLLNQYKDRRLTVSLSSTRLCTRRSLLQSFLFELGLEYQAKDEGELRLGLTEFLRKSSACENGVLLLVDEAHTLPMHLLDELRVLTNIVRAGRNLVQLVLAGSSRLEENLSEPSMDSFNQRVACRAYLSSVGREELDQYLKFQLNRVGSRSDLFTSDAVKSIHIATNGIPRLINQLAEFALVCAAEKKDRQIDGDLIQWAWSTMQQIPITTDTPKATSSNNASGANESSESSNSCIIEFGELDDDIGAAQPGQLQPIAAVAEQDEAQEAGANLVASDSINKKTEVPKPVIGDATTNEAKVDTVEEVPAVITFAFEQDIQRPKVVDNNAVDNKTVDNKTGELGREELAADEGCDDSLINEKALEAVAAIPPRDVTPALDTQGTIDRIHNTMDVVNHALDSLDDDWLTVEKVLAEAELEAVVRPMVSDPQQNFPALAGDKQKGPQVKPAVDPKAVFDDHLFNESEIIDDTQWGRFLIPEDESPDVDPMIETVEAIEAELNDIELKVAAQIRIDSDQDWVVTPHFEVESREAESHRIESLQIGNRDRVVQEDDRRIIQQSKTEEISVSHDPHVDLNPPAARRKDLRALLTALRGY